MEKELKIQSVVVLAQSFNTTIFNPHWLVKNNLINESDIDPTSIFAQNVTQVVTKQISLLVLPDQLQFTSGAENGNFVEDINNTLVPIISKLQEIPYKAVGLNFNWFIKDENKSIQELSKELFFNEKSKLFQLFDDGNPKFGTYLSKEFKSTRLKLDIKPVTANLHENSNPIEYIACNFNFHLDLHNPDTATVDLINLLKEWTVFHNESKKIIEIL
jgi:hypothetical protein